MTAARQLRAGPVRLELADGELRYLFVGNREIVRRIYFAVRFDDKWDTAPNEITHCAVRANAENFDVHLTARCRVGPIDYAWTAVIAGTTDGTITYRVRGEAMADCSHTRRTGIQVLLGTPDAIGCSYELTDATGATSRSAFPALLMPDNLPANFRTLRYATPGGARIAIEFSGAAFGIEDQRNFNETSFKLFSAHAHTYPSLPRGQAAEAGVVIRLSGVTASALPPSLSARIGAPIADARAPHIFESDADAPHTLFYRFNHDPSARPAASGTLTWAYTPAINLYDDATFMDNIAAAPDQARTARAWPNPPVTLRVDPIHFDSLHLRPARDPRNTSTFGAAWCVAFVKWLAFSAIDEAAFRAGPGRAQELQQTLAEFAGAQVRNIEVSGPRPRPIEAFGLDATDGRASLWFVNVTKSRVSLPVANFSARSFRVRRSSDSHDWTNPSSLPPVAEGKLMLELSPYEVCAFFSA